MSVRKIRYLIFLKDIFILALTAFGGPQAHFALFLRILVQKRVYLTESELIELNALCSILPGPTSTQTITAVAFKMGGPTLAYLTLLVWILPASSLMLLVAIGIDYIQEMGLSLRFTHFIAPIAVALVAYSATRISFKIVHTKTAALLFVISAIIAYYYHNPYLLPVMLVIGGLITTYKYKKQPVEEITKMKIEWSNFFLWAIILILAAVIGKITGWLPIRIFENFYRNGSLFFGGGQVLVPMIYTEFVQFKKLLTSDEFMFGYAFNQALPGPVFSFSSFVGALSMRDWGEGGKTLGALMAMSGIFLPGTFMIFFAIRFWDGLRKYRVVKASLEGVNAVTGGLAMSAAALMFKEIDPNWMNYVMMIAVFVTLVYTKIPTPWIIIGGLAIGFLI